MEPPAAQLLPSYHLVVPDRARYVYDISTTDLSRHLEVIRVASGSDDCSLTFDDCHISQFRYAFPALQQYGLKARFFAVVGWTGKCRDYMTWEHLKELRAAGHEVQSHSFSHVPLTRCGTEELSRELRHSRHELEQKLGVAVNSISIPFGRWDERVVEASAQAGYHRVYTSDPMGPMRIAGIDVLGRFIVRRGTTRNQLRRVLSGDQRELRWLKARQQFGLMVRASLGDSAYFKLWATLRSGKQALAESR